MFTISGVEFCIIIALKSNVVGALGFRCKVHFFLLACFADIGVRS